MHDALITRGQGKLASPLSRSDEQPELCGAPYGVGTRSAIETREGVADMHVDGALREEQLCRDLAIRMSDCHQSHDLDLARGEFGALDFGNDTPARPAVDLRAQARQLRVRSSRQRPGAKPARGQVGIIETARSHCCVSRDHGSAAASEQRFGSIERQRQGAHQIQSACKMLIGLAGITLEDGDLAQRHSERAESSQDWEPMMRRVRVLRRSGARPRHAPLWRRC